MKQLISALMAIVALSGLAGLAAPGHATNTTHKRLTLVDIGDSNGDPSTECRPVCFVSLYRRAATVALHARVRSVNLSRSTDLTSSDLLGLVRHDRTFRTALRSANLVTVHIGNNDIAPCGGPETDDCYEAGIKRVEPNLKATLSAIKKLRRGKRTAIRVLDLYNYAIGDPEAPPGEAFQRFFAEKIRELNAAICGAASSEHVVCVDLLRALNGPSGAEQVTGLFTEPEIQQKIAAAIAAVGYAPLNH
jgi:hypothetical protein